MVNYCFLAYIQGLVLGHIFFLFGFRPAYLILTGREVTASCKQDESKTGETTIIL